MLILGIETSCDETAAAVVEHNPKKGDFFIHSNIISSQVKIHSKYGGIVPEVAARNHVKNIIPVVDKAMHKFKPNDIDAIAVTNGPGLITSLLVGVETAKALAYAWGKPLIAVNHLEGHIYSAMKMREYENMKINNFNFPALALIVSGGHTQLVLMTDYGKYKIIGETRDDAAGEAFDKVGKMLGLGYPGGPVVSAFAEKFLISNSPNKIQKLKFKNIKLPRPMIDSKDFDFSFSGLKTAVLYSLRAISHKAVSCKTTKRTPTAYSLRLTAEMCAEFQQAVIDVLITKTQRAAKQYNVKNIILSGGVSANKSLRERFKKEFGDKLLLPGPGLSTDNAVMIAVAGVYHFLKKDFVNVNEIKVNSNLTL